MSFYYDRDYDSAAGHEPLGIVHPTWWGYHGETYADRWHFNRYGGGRNLYRHGDFGAAYDPRREAFLDIEGHVFLRPPWPGGWTKKAWAERLQHGDFTGVGPKTYRPSDDRLREEANAALTWSDAVDAREIEVQVTDGTVTLSGRVPSRAQKRVAGRLIDALWGVLDVRNELVISSETTPVHGD